jgi:heme exporter protein D
MTDVKSYLSGQNPYDEFRGRYAIPDLVWKAHDLRTHWAFTKYLANQLGISIMYRFRTENDVEIKGWVEKLINFPILSKILGRFIRVSDYGEKEHLRRDILAPVDKQRAREVLDAHEAIAKLVNGQKLSDSDMAAIVREEARGTQVVSRTVMQDIGRKYGSAYTEALLSATSIEQKIAILREIARKQKERGE